MALGQIGGADDGNLVEEALRDVDGVLELRTRIGLAGALSAEIMEEHTVAAEHGRRIGADVGSSGLATDLGKHKVLDFFMQVRGAREVGRVEVG